jgi:nitroreductase
MTQTANDTLEFLRRLRAIREYTPEPVSDDDINAILEVARWTATGGNRQPIDVVVVRDTEVRQKFGEWGARPAATAPVVFLLVSGGDANALDEGRMAERIALAARGLGLGSVLATLKNDGPDLTKQLLGIPEDKRARTVVPVGHIDREARKALPKNPQGGRRPMEEFAHWDRF